METSEHDGPPARDPRNPRRRTGGRAGAASAIALVALLVALFAVTLAGRALFAPPAPIAALVLVLPYAYVLVAVLAFALWAVLPDRREPPVVLTLTLAAGIALWGPSWPARGEAAPGDPVEVMSWNLRRLWGGPDDGGDALECVARVIEAEAPDVLTLLEVSRDDVDRLRERLGLDCVHTNYVESAETHRGGLAACTRGPRWALRSGAPVRYVDHRDWSYVFSEVSGEGRVFNVLAVHLHPYPVSVRRLRTGVRELARGAPGELTELSRDGREVFKAQSDQAAALLERVRGFQDPTLVAGDFNSTRDAALHAALRRTLTDTWERGGFGMGATMRFLDVLPLRIDYVYASDAFAVLDAEVPEVGCSDHRPVVSRLVLRE